MRELTECIAKKIMDCIKDTIFIEVEASGRHVHLCPSDREKLFGTGYTLTKVRDLSQPGQYVCQERVSISGPKGSIHNVVILGPERKETQVEISLTDAMALGISAPPIRLSGEVSHSPGAKISNGKKEISIQEGIIVAKRHIHITPEDAAKYHVSDKERVKVKVFGDRPLIFDDTVVRVSENFRTVVHIDYDEANACGYHKGVLACILK